jgi:hypothetical protein
MAIGQRPPPVRLYSYIVAHDTGFAPNPFWGYCTLATCKPSIRRVALPGDWIVGLQPKASGHGVVYFMQVQEVLTIPDYFADKRFSRKMPDFTTQAVVDKCGDSIYEPLPGGGFRQLQSMHSHLKSPVEDPRRKAHDLKGVNVLVSRQFAYFGSDAKPLPPELKGIVPGRGHRCRFPDDLVSGFIKFTSRFRTGVYAPPCEWRSGDLSWRSCSE